MNHGLLIKLAVYSLVFLWIFTGLTSMFFAPNVAYEILEKAAITGQLATLFIYAGGVLDIFIGLWLSVRFKIRLCCIAQIMVISIYTLLLTVIDVSFWLHPFGPITKNFPIIILIIIVYWSPLASRFP
ncbi:MAG: DoxX-like family protein [Oceanospirillaceae bacterium]